MILPCFGRQNSSAVWGFQDFEGQTCRIFQSRGLYSPCQLQGAKSVSLCNNSTYLIYTFFFWSQPWAQCHACVFSLNPHNNLWSREYYYHYLHFTDKKLRRREIELPAQGHRACECSNQDSDPEFALLSAALLLLSCFTVMPFTIFNHEIIS